MTTTGRLCKSKSDRILCGVSGGLAGYFDIDPSLVRIGWIVLTCFTFSFAGFAYLFLCAVLPDDQNTATEPSNTTYSSSGRGSPGPSSKVSNEELTKEAQVLLEVRQELGPDYEDELLDSFVERAEEALKSRRSKTGRQTDGSGGPGRGISVFPLLFLGFGATSLVACNAVRGLWI